MSVGLFTRREFQGLLRRGDLFRDRMTVALALGATLGGCLLFWDWKGWDRGSVLGAASFSRFTFGLIVAMQAMLSAGFVMTKVGTIAAERDKKTLDALLTTRLSSAQIVLGIMAASLFRLLNGMAVAIPFVLWMIYAGGIDARLVLLAGLGVASTTLGVAALSAVASVESRTATNAARMGVGLLYGWFVLPIVLLQVRALLLPPLPAWVVEPILWAVDSGPLALLGNLLGVVPRPWGLTEAVFRMALLQVVVGVALASLASRRLRRASRALYDVEGRRGFLAALRAANRPIPRRRPCGADPVYWNEVYALARRSRPGRVAGHLGHLLAGLMLAVGTYWFAAPAFVELSVRGYGPSAEAFRMPAVNPFARVIVEHLVVRNGTEAEPGQARLEFNLALRQFTAVLAMGLLLAIFSAGVEAVARERRRDTWLGLLATPLTGLEIVRGKVLGILRRSREPLIQLLVLWTLGLASGAVHPLGFVATVAWLGVSAPLYGMIGVGTALYWNRETSGPTPLIRPLAGATSLVLIFAMTFVPLIFVMASLFTYEDIRAVADGRGFPPIGGTGLRFLGARVVAFLVLAVIAGVAIWAWVIARSLFGSFDAMVGRPSLRSAELPAQGSDLKAPALRSYAS